MSALTTEKLGRDRRRGDRRCRLRPPARRRRASRRGASRRSRRTAPWCSAICTSTTRRRWRSAGSSARWRCSARASYPEIFRVTLDPAKNPAAAYLRGTFDWHLDGATDDIPIMATVLSAHAVAASGGETEFASTYAAYDDLADDEKERYLRAPRRAQLRGLATVGEPRPVREGVGDVAASGRRRRTRWCGATGRGGARSCSAPPRRTSTGWTSTRAARCWRSCSPGRRRPIGSTATSGTSATW